MANEKQTLKAWGIDWSKIDEGAYHSGNIESVHAETIGKAKYLLLKEASDYKLRTGDDIEYRNIPVIRYPKDDLYLFNDKHLTMEQIEEYQRIEKRLSELDLIMNSGAITHCMIKRHGDYYRENYKGYTYEYLQAGIYRKEDAIAHGKNIHDITIIPLDNEKHNQRILVAIEDLKRRLINADNLLVPGPFDVVISNLSNKLNP